MHVRAVYLPADLLESAASPLTTECRRLERGVLVSVRGEADLTNAARLESEVRRHLVPGEPLVLDLSLLTFMDSNGLRALENLDAVVHAQGGTLHLAGVHGIAARLLQVTGVWSRLDIHSGVAGAVRRALGRDAAPA